MSKDSRTAFATLALLGSLTCLSGQGCLPPPITGETPGSESSQVAEPPYQQPQVTAYRTKRRTYFNDTTITYLGCHGATGQFTIHTTDGSTPSRSNGYLCTEPLKISISQDTVIKYIICQDGYRDSQVVTHVFTKYTGLPESPHPYPAGEYLEWEHTHHDGGYVQMTFDAQCALAAGDTIYVQHVSDIVNDTPAARFRGKELAGRTLRRDTECPHLYIALDSSSGSQDWGFKVSRIERGASAPLILSGDGRSAEVVTFNDSVTVTLGHGCGSRGDSTFFFTTDGSTPGRSHGTLYTAPIVINDTTVLKAIACEDGLLDSFVTTGVYTKSAAYPETGHPYAIGLPAQYASRTQSVVHQYWFYRVPGRPQSVSLTFDTASELASTDQVTILYASRLGDEVTHLTELAGGAYTGTQLAGRTVEVPGDTVIIRLGPVYHPQPDGGAIGYSSKNAAEHKWGFRVTEIRDAGPVAPLADPGDTGGTPSVADRVIALVNEARAKDGLHPLRKSALLAQVAATYAARMAERGFFSHTDPDTGSQPYQRAADSGYDGWYVSENIAAGQRTPEAVMDDWMKSWGHRANILSDYATEIGVGAYEGGEYGVYWVQMFGRPR